MRGLLYATCGCAVMMFSASAFAQSATFDFEDGTTQGFAPDTDSNAGTPPVVTNATVDGEMMLSIDRVGGFQQARRTNNGMDEDFYAAFNAAAADPDNYQISYDYYIDTSLLTTTSATDPTASPTFAQITTYANSDGASGYQQDVDPYDIEIGGGADGLGGDNILTGTITETFTEKGYTPGVDAGYYQLGFIINSDFTGPVYFDNITITPVAAVPEPASLALMGLGGVGMLLRRRRHA